MTRPLRLALIAPFPVLPTRAGGKIRIVQLARSLSRLGVDVTIIAPFHFTQTRTLVDREPFALVEVRYPPLVLPFLLVDRPFPYGCLISFHPGYGAMLPVSLDSFDVCQFEHPAFVDLARTLPASVPIVYGSQNVEVDYVSAESRPGAVRRLASARMHALEAELISRASHVFACTEGDRERFGELYGAPREQISVIPNGVDLAAVDAERAGRNGAGLSPPFERRAVFIGSDVKHNRVAAQTLLERVAPHFEREVEFVFLGPCARRLRGPRGTNVVIDPAGELAQYSTSGTIGLNPVVSGSGSNLKLLYYLAHDLPALSTPFGVRGYDDLSPWVTTAELDDFPKALRSAVTSPDGVRERLRRYEWDVGARTAIGVYEELAGRARRSPS